MTTLHSRARPEEERRRGAPCVRRAAAAGALLQRLEPPLGRPSHLTEARFSGPGLVLGGVFLAASLAPSLLPRPVGRAGRHLRRQPRRRLRRSGSRSPSGMGLPRHPPPRGRLREGLVGAAVAVCVGLLVLAVWKQVGWQNDIRLLYGMPPIGPDGWPLVAAVTLLVAAALLLLGRSLGAAFRAVRGAGSAAGCRAGWPPSSAGSVVVVALWAVFSGVLVTGFFAGRQRPLRPVRPGRLGRHDGRRPPPPGPAGPGRSVRWTDLGAEGRDFVSGGPTVETSTPSPAAGPGCRCASTSGCAAPTPSRSAPPSCSRELQRTGAFDRKVLVLATTTGTGYLDRNGTDPLEYLWNGDTAIAGVQYSYLPSWISLLADQDAARETSQAVFSAVHRYWSTLPEATPAAPLPLRALARVLRGREHPRLDRTSSTSRSTARCSSARRSSARCTRS